MWSRSGTLQTMGLEAFLVHVCALSLSVRMGLGHAVRSPWVATRLRSLAMGDDATRLSSSSLASAPPAVILKVMLLAVPMPRAAA